jgi:IPT/TIG domain
MVTGLSPSTGPVAGGTTVKIRGSGFGGVTAVDLGRTPATILALNKKRAVLKVGTPSRTGSGSAPVVVTIGSLVPTDLFTYHKGCAMSRESIDGHELRNPLRTTFRHLVRGELADGVSLSRTHPA